MTAFFLTLSNPLILFLFIGLFARLNFFTPDTLRADYFAGYVSIFLGAISWWFTITYLINKVRTRFNLRSIWLINRSIGIIIIIMAIVGFIMGINSYFSLNLF